MTTTTYTQHHLTLPPLARGSHLITDHITTSLPQISAVKTGLLHLFLQHTSCALSMNENWDGDVRADMSDALDGIVKEDIGALRFFSLGDWMGWSGGAVGWEGWGKKDGLWWMNGGILVVGVCK